MAPAPKYSPQEQEEIILNAAAECISQTSVLDFTMSAVSKAAKLSMGSIYKHVQCKEDIIFAKGKKIGIANMPLLKKEISEHNYFLDS